MIEVTPIHTGDKKPRLFLSGKITGAEYYWSKFHDAAQKLEEAGYNVVNPVEFFPQNKGLSRWAYMQMCAAILDECDVVCFLPDWVDSIGAQFEYGRATAERKEIIYFNERREEQGNKAQTIKAKLGIHSPGAHMMGDLSRCPACRDALMMEDQS